MAPLQTRKGLTLQITYSFRLTARVDIETTGPNKDYCQQAAFLRLAEAIQAARAHQILNLEEVEVTILESERSA